MARERTFYAWIALTVVALILSVTNAARMIGNPTRWVDVLTILAFAFAGGAFFARAMMKRRATK
jgi:hypothetical protein